MYNCILIYCQFHLFFGGHVVALLYSCKPARGGDQVSTLSRSLLSSTNKHGAQSMAWFYARFPVGAARRPPAVFGIGHIWAVNKTLFEASENSKTFLQVTVTTRHLSTAIAIRICYGGNRICNWHRIYRWGFFSNICSTKKLRKNAGRIRWWPTGLDRFERTKNPGIQIIEGFLRLFRSRCFQKYGYPKVDGLWWKIP